METFREKLKIQNITMIICIAVLAFFMAYSFCVVAELLPFPALAAGDDHWRSSWLGFIAGASGGILAMMAYCLIRNLRALKDEKKLRKLFVKENDERQIQIWTAARAAGCQSFLLLGLVAIIVAGYFSITVAMTILACVLALSLICLCMKIYFAKKY